MKVGIIGSGGREHAILRIGNNSKKIEQIYCFPGEPSSTDATNISLNLEAEIIKKDFIVENGNKLQ